jgi:hypothetical protein
MIRFQGIFGLRDNEMRIHDAWCVIGRACKKKYERMDHRVWTWPSAWFEDDKNQEEQAQ